MLLNDDEFVIDDPEVDDPHMWTVGRVSEDGSFEIGPLYVTFDKKTVLNLWTDYPQKFTPEQIQIMREEQPYWYEFFMPRLEEA